MEWIKYVSIGGITLVLGWLAKSYNWVRLLPKEAIDVKKVEQEIKSDQVTTAIEVTNLMLTRLTQAENRLTNVEEENDKLRLVIASLRGTISDTKAQMKELMDDLTECLKHKDCDDELRSIRKKYGLDN